MEKAKKFQDLVVWQKSHQLALKVYKLTQGFPAIEKFGLISQMRRASVSIPANIAEGFVKNGKKDKMHFYNIAQGSLEELKYYFILSEDFRYCDSGEELRHFSDEIGKMLSGLIHSIRKAS